MVVRGQQMVTNLREYKHFIADHFMIYDKKWIYLTKKTKNFGVNFC